MLKKIILSPIKYLGPAGLLGIVTTAKSFRDNPILGSQLLNTAGLHVVRLVFAHSTMTLRMWLLSRNISKEDRQFFFANGYLIKENFLDDTPFNALANEVRNFDNEIREAHQGNTITQRASLSPSVLKNNPKIKSFLNNSTFKSFYKFTSGHNRTPFFYIEQVINGVLDSKNDPQKHFHCDTFHPSMKCWFFLEDVKTDEGAFTFIPKSHQLSKERIAFQYRMSQVAKTHENILHGKGSTRFSEKDLASLNLPKPIQFTVKKNTLVITNVFGIHKRGDAKPNSSRLAIWGDSRTNPFVPLPGLGGSFIDNIQHYFLKRFRAKHDLKSQKSGVRSPWELQPKGQKLFKKDIV